MKSPLARDQNFPQAVWWELCSQPMSMPLWTWIPVEGTQVWSRRNVQATQIPPFFLQKLHFLQTSVRSRGQCVALSLFPLNLVWDLFLVKISGAFKKPSSRRPLLSVCFHPCLGNTMNADVVGNFWLSIGFFCGNFKALWLVIFWDFKWICLAFRALI